MSEPDLYPRCPCCFKVILDDGPMARGEQRVVNCMTPDGRQCMTFSAAFDITVQVSQQTSYLISEKPRR